MVAALANHAVKQAVESIGSALDSLSFETGRSSLPLPIAWSPSPPIALINLTDERWSGSWELVGWPKTIQPIGAVEDDIVAKAKASSVAVITQTTQTLALGDQIRRALRHLRHAETATLPGQEFLAYWIALEAILGKSPAVADVPAVAAGLFCTWRNVIGVCVSERSRKRLINQMLSGYPDSPTGNDVDHFVFISIRETTVGIRVTSREDRYATWLSILDPPQPVDLTISSDPLVRFGPAVEREVTYRRAQVTFCLNRLYDLRNELVHEALLYRPDLAIQANALGAITRDVIGKIVDLHCQGCVSSIADIRLSLDAPWMR